MEGDESDIVRLLRRGRVGIARVRLHKEIYWEIDCQYPGGMEFGRRRFYRKSPTAAYRLAVQKTKEYKEHGKLANALSTSQRWVAYECFRLLAPVTNGEALELLYILRDYLKRHPLGGNARTLDDVRKELIAKKSKMKRSERHVSGLDYKLRTLIASVGNKLITQLTTGDLEEELESHPDWKATTIHSTVQGWKILLNFAVRRGYLFENPADRLELPKIIREEPKILTVDQAKRLMAATLFRDRHPLLPDCRAYLAIGMFAGIRPEEMVRLKWGQVDLGTATITIRWANAKCRDRRIVDMSPNLVAWLRPLARSRGLVLRAPIDELRAAARGVLGFPSWPMDVLRHTFASYHYAQHRNEALTKHQMGHRDDGRLLHNHYCVPVHPIEAAKFWGIVPPVGLLTA